VISIGLLDALARARTGSIIDGEGQIGIDLLLSRSRAVAAALRARSLFGRRVAVFAAPNRAFVIAVLGVMWSGATAVVLSPLHPAPELAAACARARVELVIDGSVAGVPSCELDDLARAGDPPFPAPNDDALILFTSGTTAAPKGARLTHANLWAHSRVLHDAWRWSSDDRLVHALPLHHLHGLGTALFTALTAGATTELLPRFDPALVLDAAVRSTVWMAVPTTIARVLAADSSEGLRRLRLVTNGSAALPRVHSDRFLALVGERPLERFGMTEAGVVTTQPIDGLRVPGDAGRAVPGMDVRIVDDEIQVRGAGVFPGYDDDSNRDAFVDGWFRTGDSGALDDHGSLTVRGRISVDVLKSGGYKLSALEIEHAIREYPGIEDVAVVGVPDEEWGDLVTAVIVPREVDIDSLRGFLRERLAPYKVPKRFVLRDALPRNSIGKVTKPRLIETLSRERQRPDID
jgi:malonyl-CoA/methylmalonyl-CoA synthetase